MLELKENGCNITITLKNKLSIENVSDIICLSVNNEQLPLTQLAPKFKSTSVNSDDENILNGIFTLSNGIIFSAPNSTELQNLYLQWEATQLNRSSITFKVPTSRYDSKGGVAPYNPYFFAIVNKLARTTHGFDLIGFGEYLSRNEMKFVHQYCSFHPALRNYISLKDESGISERVSISCKAFELIVDNALAHVEGYRDKIRFESLYQLRDMRIEVESESVDFASSKFLMEYEHVLDAPSIWKESIDFYSYESSGGFLDVLNLPFQV